MEIHTINLGFYESIPNISLPNLKIWNNDDIKNILSKEPKYLNFYNNLLLLKSRENLAKYFILKEYGGLYININLLGDKQIFNSTLVNAVTTRYDYVYWKNYYQSDFIKNIHKINGPFLSDEIIYVKNKNSLLINYLIDNIKLNNIPENELENKYMLGDVYFSQKIDFFYNNKNIPWTESSDILYKQSLEFNDGDEKKSLYKTKIKNHITLDNYEYKNNINPNIFELLNPDKTIDSWNWFHKVIYICSNIIIMGIYYTYSVEYFLISILIASIIDWIFAYIIKESCNFKTIPAKFDNKIFYDSSKFKLFDNIIKNWKIITKEAKNVLDKSPKLNISRKYNEWKDSEDYINKIKDEHGWIKSWKYSDSEPDKSSELVNFAWENFGLIYNNIIFSENVKQCPKTYKILKKIKKHINICGFSYMKGNCILEKHTDCTGPEYNSLAFHLGLIIPSNNDTCKLVVKSKSDNKYYSISEKPGQHFIFDATNEHYAYNQSSEDRVILYIDFKI